MDEHEELNYYKTALVEQDIAINSKQTLQSCQPAYRDYTTGIKMIMISN